jgi:hypothetical protein
MTGLASDFRRAGSSSRVESGLSEPPIGLSHEHCGDQPLSSSAAAAPILYVGMASTSTPSPSRYCRRPPRLRRRSIGCLTTYRNASGYPTASGRRSALPLLRGQRGRLRPSPRAPRVGYAWDVIAPSRSQRPECNTRDKHDTTNPARHYRAGELTRVRILTEAGERIPTSSAPADVPARDRRVARPYPRVLRRARVR